MFVRSVTEFAGIAIFPLCVIASGARAGEQDTIYTLTAFVGGGGAHSFSILPSIPGHEFELQNNGFGAFVRVMWTPEHLLSVGLESGISQVYRVSAFNIQTVYGTTDLTSSLTVIPFALSFSMHLTEHLEGYVASTSYLLLSETQSFNNNVSGSMWSIGFSAALAYMLPVGNGWDAGGELKWLHMDKSGDNVVMLHLVVSYRFLQW